MAQLHKTTQRRPRIADEIMAGMQELVDMMHAGKSPEEVFTVRTFTVPDPAAYRARQVRDLREALGVSQAVFASLLGVSTVLVKSWERGVRAPNLMARRLMDTIKADPARWLSTVQEAAA